MKRVDPEFLPRSPAGSKIAYDGREGDRGAFLIARAGRSPADLAAIAVAGSWMVLVGWLTWNAVQANWWLAAVCAPFWMVGLVVAHQIARSLTERQKIVLHDDRLEIFKRSAVGSRRESIGYGEIEGVGMEREVPLNPTATFRFMNRTRKDGRVKRAVPRLVIRHGARKAFVAEHVSESEMEWLSEALSRALGR